MPVTRQDAFEAPPLRPLRYLSNIGARSRRFAAVPSGCSLQRASLARRFDGSLRSASPSLALAAAAPRRCPPAARFSALHSLAASTARSVPLAFPGARSRRFAAVPSGCSLQRASLARRFDGSLRSARLSWRSHPLLRTPAQHPRTSYFTTTPPGPCGGGPRRMPASPREPLRRVHRPSPRSGGSRSGDPAPASRIRWRRPSVRGRRRRVA